MAIMSDTEDKEKIRVLEETLSRKDALELYEKGKDRRYTLLFAVNGGAFAVAKLIKEGGCNIGGLSHPVLSIGMVLFTVAMVWDIYAFGEKRSESPKSPDVFGKVGRRVLLLIGLLICLGWLLVGFR
jgi:hypothetical protein